MATPSQTGHTPPPSPAEANLLMAVAAQTETEALAGTNALSAALGVSPTTVSQGVAQLAAKGWLEHRPRRGARLTPQGTQWVAQQLWARRLWAWFATAQLGLAAAEASAWAQGVAAASDPEADLALYHRLAAPAADADGQPLAPPPHLRTTPQATQPLAQLPLGARFRLDAEAAPADYRPLLWDLGLAAPKLWVLSQRLAQPPTLLIRATDDPPDTPARALPAQVAAQIWVTPSF